MANEKWLFDQSSQRNKGKYMIGIYCRKRFVIGTAKIEPVLAHGTELFQIVAKDSNGNPVYLTTIGRRNVAESLIISLNKGEI